MVVLDDLLTEGVSSVCTLGSACAVTASVSGATEVSTFSTAFVNGAAGDTVVLIDDGAAGGGGTCITSGVR